MAIAKASYLSVPSNPHLRHPEFYTFFIPCSPIFEPVGLIEIKYSQVGVLCFEAGKGNLTIDFLPCFNGGTD